MRSTGILTLIVFAVIASSALGQQIYSVGDNGVTAPRVVKAVTAAYTQKARDARIEGVVTLRAVVLADGSVSDIVVTQSLDASLNGLDDQAVIALKKWVFEPGTKDGKPVAVRGMRQLVFLMRSAPTGSAGSSTTTKSAVSQVNGWVPRRSAPR